MKAPQTPTALFKIHGRGRCPRQGRAGRGGRAGAASAPTRGRREEPAREENGGLKLNTKNRPRRALPPVGRDGNSPSPGGRGPGPTSVRGPNRLNGRAPAPWFAGRLLGGASHAGSFLICEVGKSPPRLQGGGGSGKRWAPQESRVDGQTRRLSAASSVRCVSLFSVQKTLKLVLFPFCK